MAIMGTQGSAAVKPIENSPKGSQLQKLGSFTSLDDRFPSTPLPVVVQGRKGGPVERYRVASWKVCLAARILGWLAVFAGAAELAIGVVIFNIWGREGGWWAGVLGAVLGILGTGITADTPVGTRLFSWLVWSSLVTFLATIMTLLALDGRRWLDTKDLEACQASFDDFCSDSRCTCTAADRRWDVCFDIDRCSDLVGSRTALMASSIVLLVLSVDSALLFALGIKCRYFGGGVLRGGNRSYPGRRRSYHIQTSHTDTGPSSSFGASNTASAAVHDETRLRP